MDRTFWGSLLTIGAVIVGSAGLAGFLATRPASRPAPPEIREGAVLTVDPAAVRGIDHRLVHEELVPDWIGARGGMKALYFERLRREVAAEPNLGALLDRMAALSEKGPGANASELEAMVQTWNDVMATADVGYRLEGDVAGAADEWWLKAYLEVSSDAEVVVDGATFGVTVRRRVDSVAPPDAWLGQLHGRDERVVILLDRVTSFTLDRIWPMLDPRLDGELDPISTGFASAVRTSVARVLSPDALARLEQTAEDRYWLLRATQSIHDRATCGSTFRIAGLPWNGLDPADQAALHVRAVEDRDGACPEVTEREALVFRVRSRHLRAQEGVREALEQLVAFVARAVVVHEARHAADLAARRDGRELTCRGCPPELSDIGVWEGSAYLTTFAEPDLAAVALFQACDIDPTLRPERAAVVRFLAVELARGGCDGPPPADLPARARALGEMLYGRSPSIELRGFPVGLPVSSHYGSR